jgi:hypothetical protein
MIVTSCQAFVPRRNSLPHAVAADPNVGIVVGGEAAVPSTLLQEAAIQAGGGKLLPLKPEAIGKANYDKLIGKQITLAELGIELTDQALTAASIKLPDGAGTAFEVAGLIVSTAATYHAFTREDATVWDQAICSVKTLSILGDLIAPAVPQLAQCQPALKLVSLLLKGVKTTDEIIEIRFNTGPE